MRSLALDSRAALLLACLTVLVGSNARPLWAQAPSVCHDGSWDHGEFCGRDAYLVTGKTEMNHDCKVEVLDIFLFAAEWGLFGSNLSADINGDAIVSVTDFMLFVGSFGDPVSPCNPSGMLPDGCEGTIALSFSSDPETIDSTQTLSPDTVDRAYVAIEGWTNPQIVEYAVEASSNVTIVDHPPTVYPYWEPGIQVFCDPDPQHSWRTFVGMTGSWPTGPISYAYLDYQVEDTEPAWIKLVPVPSCHGNSRIRWAQSAANRSFDFATVLNVGINGPAPPGESTCAPPLPALNPPMLWVLGSILLAIAVLVLGFRQSARAYSPSGTERATGG